MQSSKNMLSTPLFRILGDCGGATIELAALWVHLQLHIGFAHSLGLRLTNIRSCFFYILNRQLLLCQASGPSLSPDQLYSTELCADNVPSLSVGTQLCGTQLVGDRLRGTQGYFAQGWLGNEHYQADEAGFVPNTTNWYFWYCEKLSL